MPFLPCHNLNPLQNSSHSKKSFCSFTCFKLWSSFLGLKMLSWILSTLKIAEMGCMTYRFLIIHWNFHNYQVLKKRWIVWLVVHLLLPRKLNMLQRLHQEKSYRWQMTMFANCLTHVNSLRNSSQFQQVYSCAVFLRSRIYFRACLERFVWSWTSFRSWHSEQGQSKDAGSLPESSVTFSSIRSKYTKHACEKRRSIIQKSY